MAGLIRYAEAMIRARSLLTLALLTLGPALAQPTAGGQDRTLQSTSTRAPAALPALQIPAGLALMSGEEMSLPALTPQQRQGVSAWMSRHVGSACAPAREDHISALRAAIAGTAAQKLAEEMVGVQLNIAALLPGPETRAWRDGPVWVVATGKTVTLTVAGQPARDEVTSMTCEVQWPPVMPAWAQKIALPKLED